MHESRVDSLLSLNSDHGGSAPAPDEAGTASSQKPTMVRCV